MDKVREYFTEVVGVNPDDFWINTLGENLSISRFYNRNIDIDNIRQRSLEFALYNTSFRGMNGEKSYKKIAKPSDLYKLSTDSEVKTEGLSGDAANDFLKTSGLVKQT